MPGHATEFGQWMVFSILILYCVQIQRVVDGSNNAEDVEDLRQLMTQLRTSGPRNLHHHQEATVRILQCLQMHTINVYNSNYIIYRSMDLVWEEQALL